jgi:hypothetical protein
LDNRAKRRHARCSDNNSQSKLNERTGVSSNSSVTRSNCAALKSLRRPEPAGRGKTAMITSSGM